jgi:IS30 family transposase
MWVSIETIYQSLYVQSRGALRRELTKCLRTGRALRIPNRFRVRDPVVTARSAESRSSTAPR